MVRKSKEKEKTGDGSGSTDGSVAPFLRKCYEMVDDEEADSIISWTDTNDSFVIRDVTQFSISMLPKYFKHSNFSSFMRQLNIYGFRKIDPDRYVFANEGFIRGQKHLLKNIFRRKYPQGTDQRKVLQQKDNPDEPCEDMENGLWREVENLKIDKISLKQELVKLRQHQEMSDNKLLLLRDRLHGMEKDQQQMLSFLVMAMQNPGFLVQLLQPKENNWRMAEAGNMLEEVDDGRPVAANCAIVRYQPPMDEAPKPVLTPHSGSGRQPEFDSYPDGMKDFFMNSDFMKMLMDDKLSPRENQAPFILPDADVDDNAWEKLLLTSYLLENIEGAKEERKEPDDSRMEVESTVAELDESENFDSLLEQMKESVYGSNMENSQNLEPSGQLGLVASDPNNRQETESGK
ncbi:hypothetical protein M0R45_022504 [Rubus argutus]|uniref:HSF-type DNA-binding domain-containing protein n=1 Tax=Rubus argutus TaxID=59490 RepID=A0AAW1XEQ0_RUBAR